MASPSMREQLWLFCTFSQPPFQDVHIPTDIFTDNSRAGLVIG